MSDELRAWLSEELQRRKWSHGELARQSGISRPFISQVLSGDVSPSINFCYKVASALDESPEKILRLAGILPADLAWEEDDTVQELMDLIRDLPPEDRQELLQYARFKRQQKKRG